MKIKSTLMNRYVGIFLFNFFLLCSCFSVMGQIVDYNWAIKIGGLGTEAGRGIAAASSGNKYAVGTFGGTTDFNGDTSATAIDTIRATGTVFGYIAKYDNTGKYVWAKGLGGIITNTSVNPNAVVIDSMENIYVTGYFYGTVDLDPGVGVANVTSQGVGASLEIFIAKYDANGNYLWGGAIGSIGSDQGLGLALDDSANLYVSGIFAGTADFDFGTGEAYRTATGGGDAFFAKYTTAGKFVWAKNIGGIRVVSTSNAAYAITVDAKRNVYLGGFFSGTVDFDPGAGTAIIDANISGNAFVAKYDPSGNYVWAGKIGNAGPVVGIALLAGRLYTTGYFSGVAADFDLSPVDSVGVLNKGAGGFTDMFLASYATDGKYLWAKGIGGTGSENPSAIQAHKSGYVYMTGYFQNTVDFDPGPDSTKLVTAGSNDVFIAAYDTLGKFSWARKVGGTGNDWGYGISVDATRRVHVTGQFNTRTDFNPGADSVYITPSGGAGNNDAFVLQLSTTCFVNASTEGAGCKSFTLNGQTYTSSGSYTQTYPLPSGCDSVITIKVIINDKDTAIAATACKEYWLNGQIYNATGVYKQTRASAAGCDSTITLHLTINPLPTATTSASGKILTSSRGDSYQWINCSDKSAIAGATNQTYTANTNGSYAVVVTVNGCSDTSDCITVGPASVNELDNENGIVCYPNPTENRLNIDTKKAFENADIRVVNVLGQYVVEQKNQRGTHFTIDLTPCAAGIYSCEVVEKGNMKRIKIIKK